MSSRVVAVAPDAPLPHGWEASVHLAGPPADDPQASAWYDEVLRLLREGWSGTGLLVAFVPVGSDGVPVERSGWAEDRRRQADAIICWASARDASGVFARAGADDGGRSVVVLPDCEDAARLREDAARRGVRYADSPAGAVGLVLAGLGGGARRDGSARQVPLPLWRTPSFRYWLDAQVSAGNRLDDLALRWSMPLDGVPGVFLWLAHPRVHIGAEDRVKENEVVIGRTDLVTVVAYARGRDVLGTRVVLVREFRSPAATGDGYVHELPGGTDPTAETPLAVAVAEFAEETGLHVAAPRLRYHRARQPVATLLAHRQHVYSVELTEAEARGLSTATGVYGDEASGERTTVEVATYRQIIDDGLADWVTVGIVSAVLATVL